MNAVVSAWEARLRIVDAPKSETVLRAPPTLIPSPGGTRYRCGRCGRGLLVADFGKAVGFVVQCGGCGRYNEVTI